MMNTISMVNSEILNTPLAEKIENKCSGIFLTKSSAKTALACVMAVGLGVASMFFGTEL